MSGNRAYSAIPDDLLGPMVSRQWETKADREQVWLLLWYRLKRGLPADVRGVAQQVRWHRSSVERLWVQVRAAQPVFHSVGSMPQKQSETGSRQRRDEGETAKPVINDVTGPAPRRARDITETRARDPLDMKKEERRDHAVELPGKPHTESTPPEIDHVVTLCELYREHSHRLTRTGRRGRIGDSPGLRRMWGSALEVAEDHGFTAETLIAMFELVFTTKRGEFWQRGGKGNQEIVSGSGLVTYLLRCKGSTYGTGQPTREKLVQRLAEAQEYLDDRAAIEQMRAAHIANAAPSRPLQALPIASECQGIGEGTEASTAPLKAFSGRGGK